MSDTKELILSIVQGKAQNAADTFDDIMIDRLRALVDSKRDEISIDFLSPPEDLEEGKPFWRTGVLGGKDKKAKEDSGSVVNKFDKDAKYSKLDDGDHGSGDSASSWKKKYTKEEFDFAIATGEEIDEGLMRRIARKFRSTGKRIGNLNKHYYDKHLETGTASSWHRTQMTAAAGAAPSKMSKQVIHKAFGRYLGGKKDSPNLEISYHGQPYKRPK